MRLCLWLLNDVRPLTGVRPKNLLGKWVPFSKWPTLPALCPKPVYTPPSHPVKTPVLHTHQWTCSTWLLPCCLSKHLRKIRPLLLLLDFSCTIELHRLYNSPQQCKGLFLITSGEAQGWCHNTSLHTCGGACHRLGSCTMHTGPILSIALKPLPGWVNNIALSIKPVFYQTP